MIWRKQPDPRLGDERVVCRFAWLPTAVSECRVWLRLFWARERYERVCAFYPPPFARPEWCETRRGLTRAEALES